MSVWLFQKNKIRRRPERIVKRKALAAGIAHLDAERDHLVVLAFLPDAIGN